MNKVILILFFVPISAFSEVRTPAFEQYMQQLACTTEKAIENLGLGLEKKAAVTASAESCVPEQFVPELRGLRKDLVPSTRTQRLASLTDSALLRLTLCEHSQVKATACLSLFQKSE